MNGLRVGVVVDTHPEDNSVDLVMTDDFTRVVGAQVLSLNGSNRTGLVDLPEVKKKGDKWDVSVKPEQELTAIVGRVAGNPVVLGFLYPQINQMLFDDKKRMLYRHQSDFMTTIDGDGNLQVTHPSGTFLRIGEGLESEDLSEKNFDQDSDQALSIDRNTSTRPGLSLSIGSNGIEAAKIQITPEGEITIESVLDKINVKALGDVSVTAMQKASVEAMMGVDVTTPMNVSVQAMGQVEVTAGMSASVTAATATITAPGGITLDTMTVTCPDGIMYAQAFIPTGG